MRRPLVAVVVMALTGAVAMAAPREADGPQSPAPGTAPGSANVPGRAAAARSGDLALMPGPGEVGNWARQGNARVFTQADLYGYIDGGAEVFLELGFSQLTLQKYRDAAREVAVEIYRMADIQAAFGIYTMKCGNETRDPSFTDRHTVNRHQLMFVRDRFFVAINNLSGGNGLESDLVRFARTAASKLPPDRGVAELSRLPAAGQVAGSTRLVRGPFTLQSIYTLGEGDVLQLGGKIIGVAANYRDAGGSFTRLAVEYPTPAAARASFANLVRNLDKYLTRVGGDDNRLVFRDYEKKYGVAAVSGRRLDITLHLAKAPAS